MAKNKNIKVVLRHDEEMEHMLVYCNGILLSDECEGYPTLKAEDIFRCLKEHDVIAEFTTESIEEEE